MTGDWGAENSGAGNSGAGNSGGGSSSGWGAGDWGAGRDPGSGAGPSGAGTPRPRRPRREPLPERSVVGGPDDGAPTGVDPIAVVAVVVGFLGIVVFGILLALIAAILGSIAGGRARESGRSLELPYLAFLLAGVDGLVWIALHYLFDIPYPVG